MELTLDGVRKEYGETVALGAGRDGVGSGRGIDLDVNDGEFFTLVGPSGCGKTTTLRLVAGFDRPTAGEIRFDGRPMDGVPPEDRGVGVVFQNYALFPHLSVAENVAYGLRFSDPPDGVTRDERVSRLLDLVDLPDAGDRDPTELSGGQRQRVALARALAPDPDLLLLDEPMSALDARLRERLRMQVKEIQSELGITTLYVTHDQEEALAISDRVAVMHDGSVEQVGTPQAVYRRPATRFVAEFVGDNNVFEGAVVSVRDRNRASAVADVDVDGATIAVATDRDVTRGDRVLFCVRPEAMTVVEVGQSAGETGSTEAETERTEAEPDTTEADTDSAGSETARSGIDTGNVLDAAVARTEFLGESTRSHLRWSGRELTVRSIDPLDGDVRVGFDPSSAHVIGIGRDGRGDDGAFGQNERRNDGQ